MARGSTASGGESRYSAIEVTPAVKDFLNHTMHRPSRSSCCPVRLGVSPPAAQAQVRQMTARVRSIGGSAHEAFDLAICRRKGRRRCRQLVGEALKVAFKQALGFRVE